MAAMLPLGVLAGLRIIEVSAFVAAPVGGMTLAQLGAEVIRIDPPGGGLDYRRWPVTADGNSMYWAGLNKGKKSVVIDFRKPEGRDLIRELVVAPGEDSGILITNTAPRWLDYASLRSKRTDIIVVTLSGNLDGSIAVDYTVNAAAGFPTITGDDGHVVNHVLPAWDLLAGSTMAVAVLAAERRRRQSGEGGLVAMSLADVAFATLGHLGQVAEAVVNQVDRRAYGNYVFGTFGKDFVTADERRVMVVALTTRQWSALVAATGIESSVRKLEQETGRDLRDEGSRFELREPIADLVAPWISSRTLTEVAEAFDAHKVLWGPYGTVVDLMAADRRVDPASNPMWAHVDQPGVGVFPVPGSTVRFGPSLDLAPRPAPELGADTDDILRQVLGMREDEIATLRSSGTI